MKVSRFVKWSVEGGAEGYQVDLGPDDIHQSAAKDINVALDQARILLYLTTYLIYSREVADGRMKKEAFEESMARFGYESRLVNALLKPSHVEALKSKVTKGNHESGS